MIIDVTVCLLSGYVYSWLACFGTDSPTNNPFKCTLIFEIIFTFSIIFKCVTSYVPEGETVPVTNHKEIFQNYKDTELKNDVIAWLPMVFFVNCSKN